MIVISGKEKNKRKNNLTLCYLS